MALTPLQGLNAQPGVTVTLRVDAGPPPARLQHIAEQAAQSGDLRSMHPADPASHARAQSDELIEGVGSGGLRRREEEEGGSTAARGFGGGGEVGTHRSICSD